jgi:hypothetical protein
LVPKKKQKNREREREIEEMPAFSNTIDFIFITSRGQRSLKRQLLGKPVSFCFKSLSLCSMFGFKDLKNHKKSHRSWLVTLMVSGHSYEGSRFLFSYVLAEGTRFFFFFFVLLGFELRIYTLSHSTSPFLWWGSLRLVLKLFAGAGFEL